MGSVITKIIQVNYETIGKKECKNGVKVQNYFTTNDRKKQSHHWYIKK